MQCLKRFLNWLFPIKSMDHVKERLSKIFNEPSKQYSFEGRGERMLRHLDQISLQLAINHNKKCLGFPVNNVLDFHWLYWSLWMLLHIGMYIHLIREAK